jgi:sulfofructose kinase
MIDIDVLCAGFACYDLVYNINYHPCADEKLFASSFLSCGGGPAANAAYTAARLGFKSAFAGYLGNDIYGQKHIDEFKSQGVITNLVIRGEEQTPLSCIMVKPDGKRMVVTYRVKTNYLTKGCINLTDYNCKVILFDGHEPAMATSLVYYAKEKKIKTILDAGSVHQGTQELIHHVDYLVASEIFAQKFTGESNEEKAIKKLATLHSAVVITLGERGIIWYHQSQFGRFPAFPVDVVDSTGCGDAFHGAFAAGIAEGMSWQDLLAFASATGALCCSKKGARPAIPERHKVAELIKHNSK